MKGDPEMLVNNSSEKQTIPTGDLIMQLWELLMIGNQSFRYFDIPRTLCSILVEYRNSKKIVENAFIFPNAVVSVRRKQHSKER